MFNKAGIEFCSVHYFLCCTQDLVWEGLLAPRCLTSQCLVTRWSQILSLLHGDYFLETQKSQTLLWRHEKYCNRLDLRLWIYLYVYLVQVNIAALMESTSEPMKIQISQTTQEIHTSVKMITDEFWLNVNLEDTFNIQELLQELGGFKTEIRGQMQVPRIGQVQLWSILFFSWVWHQAF